VRVLGAFSERAPIDKLIAILHNTKEVLVVRAVALTTLAELHPYTPVEALIAVLHDQNVHIRRYALWSLEKWGRDIPLEPLLALVDDDEYDLHDDAVQALGWLQDCAPVEYLLTLLASEDDLENAATALSRMGKYAPLDIMIAHLYDNDGDMRSLILDALADLGENAPIELIMQALDNEDADVRSNAKYALGQIVEVAPAKLVALAQHDRRTPVREALMRALAKMDTDAPIELALAALEDEDEDVRLYARIALAEQNVDATRLPIEPLLQALIEHRRSEYDSHWSELDLLARCGASVPIEPLLAALGNSQLSICKNATAALYKTHPAAFTDVAQQAEAILRGEPTGNVFASRVQSRIAEHVKLIERATPEVIAMISDLLDWPYWEVRMKAAQALGAIHRSIPDRAIKRLMELRRDPETQAVREAADEALTEILSYENGIEDE
jgi:HEAT repeat protein